MTIFTCSCMTLNCNCREKYTSQSTSFTNFTSTSPVTTTSEMYINGEKVTKDNSVKVIFNKLKSINPNAIGETGLDYFRNISPPDIQKKSFGMHIEIAKELSLPLYLHQRDAHGDFIRIIKENISNFPKFVVHCFTGTQVELNEYLELGAYIGLTGWICDAKRNIDLRKSIKNIPIEKMMIETDSPYLIPKNLTVKPNKNINEPKYLPHIANEICELTGYDLEELKLVTSNNAIEFFS